MIPALLLIQAALIAVRPGTDGDCPSPAQVIEALRVRLPGALVPFEPPLGDDIFVLSVAGGATPALTLVDGQGQVRLRRVLPAPGARERDCPALAETVALIVERFVQELDFREVALPPPPPPDEPAPAAPIRPVGGPWDLGLRTAWRPGGVGVAAYQLMLGVGRVVEGVQIGLAAGVGGSAFERWSGQGAGRLRRHPAELSVLLRLAAGPGELQAGGFAGIELLSLHARAGEASQSERRIAPVAGLEAAFRLPLGRRFFARLVTSAGVSLIRYEFVSPEGGEEAAFSTQRAYGKLAAELGLSFW